MCKCAYVCVGRCLSLHLYMRASVRACMRIYVFLVAVFLVHNCSELLVQLFVVNVFFYK